MRRILTIVSACSAVLVGAAAPALAAPTAVDVQGPTGSFTTGRSFTLTVEVTQPAGTPAYGLDAAPLHLRAPNGFTITSVSTTGQAITPPAGVDYPATDWNGAITLPDGDTKGFQVEVRAPAEAQAASEPLEVSVGSQENAAADERGTAAPVAVVAPKLTLEVPALAPLFPTEATPRITARVQNVSSHDWTGTGLPVTLTPGAGLSATDLVPAIGDGDWNVPALVAGDSAELTFRAAVERGAAAGPSVFTLTTAGAAAKVFSVDVVQPPTLTIDAPTTPLIEGGEGGELTLSVQNDASVPTKPFKVGIDVPDGFELVGAAPAAPGGVWSIPALAPGTTRTLRLTIKATTATGHPVTAQILAYGVDLVSGPVVVVSKSVPILQAPEPSPPAPPVTIPGPLVAVPSTTIAPPQDKVAIGFSQQSKSGVAYTYRGEVRYQGAPMTAAACKNTDFDLKLWKQKRGRTQGRRPADTVDVKLVYTGGHCLFGIRYSFFKRVRGNQYRLDFTARVKVPLPTRTGDGKPRRPVTAIVRRRITVGKST